MNNPGFFWEGLRILRADFFHIGGATPSLGFLYAYPTDQYSQLGQLKICDGQNTIVLQDCRIVESKPVEQPDGSVLVCHRVHDRRWRWESVRIRLKYNTIGARYRLINRKNLRDLFRIVFEQAEEYDVDLSRIPDNVLPSATFNDEPLPIVLEKFLTAGGLRLSLTLENRIVLYPLTFEDKLDRRQQCNLEVPLVGKLAMPKEVVVRFMPTIIQTSVPLEPVGFNIGTNQWLPFTEDWYKPPFDYYGLFNEDGTGRTAFCPTLPWWRTQVTSINEDRYPSPDSVTTTIAAPWQVWKIRPGPVITTNGVEVAVLNPSEQLDLLDSSELRGFLKDELSSGNVQGLFTSGSGYSTYSTAPSFPGTTGWHPSNSPGGTPTSNVMVYFWTNYHNAGWSPEYAFWYGRDGWMRRMTAATCEKIHNEWIILTPPAYDLDSDGHYRTPEEIWAAIFVRLKLANSRFLRREFHYGMGGEGPTQYIDMPMAEIIYISLWEQKIWTGDYSTDSREAYFRNLIRSTNYSELKTIADQQFRIRRKQLQTESGFKVSELQLAGFQPIEVNGTHASVHWCFDPQAATKGMTTTVGLVQEAGIAVPTEVQRIASVSDKAMFNKLR